LKKLLILLATLSSTTALAQENYPLTITSPRANLPDGHRMTRAYPGIEYNVRAVVMGGCYPFTHELSNAPAGMAIDASSGVITWPAPAADANAITLTVNDACENQATATWSIDVTTTGFQFIDAVNGTAAASNGCAASCGTGTLANPWRSLNDMHENGTAGAVTYLRGGGAVYGISDIPTSGPCQLTPTLLPETRIEWNQGGTSVIWLGYPGESRPVIDFGHDGVFDSCPSAPRFRFTGSTIWLDGLEARNTHIMAFQIYANGSYIGATVRRCRFSNGGPGLDGSNGSFVMTARTNSTFKYGGYIGENEFSDYDGVCAIKTYEEDHLLVADNLSHSVTTHVEAFAIKGGHSRVELRGNTFRDVVGEAIGGNTAGVDGYEVRFNNVLVTGIEPVTGVVSESFTVSQDSSASNVFVYRNTFVGRVRVRSAVAGTGPFSFYNNVIQNGDGQQTPFPFLCDGSPNTAGWGDCYSLDEPGQVILTSNVAGVAGVVDANGLLQGAYRTQYLGTHGHELGGAVANPRPSAPANLRIDP
jgi:hypothetical protein